MKIGSIWLKIAYFRISINASFVIVYRTFPPPPYSELLLLSINSAVLLAAKLLNSLTVIPGLLAGF